MRVKIIFEPFDDRERAALKLLIPNGPNNSELCSSGEPERQHRILGALIDILKLTIVP